MSEVLAIIQARMGSSRLPGKMLQPLFNGMGTLEIMLRRLRRSRRVDRFVVATTTGQNDDPLAELCFRIGVPCYRGDPLDVLTRYHSAYLAHGPSKAVVRLTGDCPFHDAEVVDKVIDAFLSRELDYASNAIQPTYPDGLDVEVFSPALLQLMWEEAALSSEREHVTQFVHHNPDRFKTLNVVNDNDLSALRWTIDTAEDVEFAKAATKALAGIEWGWLELVHLMEKHPEIGQINMSKSRNEGLAISEQADQLLGAPASRPAWEGKGQELYRKAKTLIPGGTQLLSKRPEMYLPDGWPAYYSKARGAEVWDLDNRHYYDFTNMSVGACPLGYADPDVDAAVREALSQGNMTTLNAPEEVDLAELLLELHPWAKSVRYTRCGGEAMAVAIRIARAATGRDKLAICGYHGWHDWYLAANLGDNSGLDGHHLPGLAPSGVPRALNGTATTFEAGDIDALEEIIRQHGDSLAAVVMEPVRNVFPAPGYLEKIKTLVHSCGALLVFDEISSGFRLCCGGSHLVFGVNPDIAVLSKGMSNGYPMAAIFGTAEAMAAAQKTFISSTYWTDRIGPSAALTCIRKYRSLKVHEHQRTIGERLLAEWKTIGGKHGLAVESGGIPALAHFSVIGEAGQAAKTLFTKIMLELGYLAGPGVYPTLAHDMAMTEKYLMAVDKAFARVSAAINAGKLEEELRPCGVAHSGFKRLN